MLYIFVFLAVFVLSFLFLTKPFLKAVFRPVPMWLVLLFHTFLGLVVAGLVYFWR